MAYFKKGGDHGFYPWTKPIKIVSPKASTKRNRQPRVLPVGIYRSTSKGIGKVSILLILIIIGSIFPLINILSPNDSSPINFTKGYIFEEQVDSVEKYEKTLVDYYEPEPNWQLKTGLNTSNQPKVVADVGFLVDINSGQTVFKKNSDGKRQIASLVKVMTAVVALEHKRPDDKIYITQQAESVGENAMGIGEGEIYTLEELLYGLILHSGNDAAYAIAEGTAGNIERFVEWMNFKAKEIGINDTYFADPSGLDDTSYSTAKDLAKLTRYALKNPKFKEVVRTVEYEIYDDKHKYIYMYNQTNLLSTYPGVAGVKTGFTEEAGLCLITYAENGGKELVGVVLNSVDRKGDMTLMLDHGFSTLGVATAR